MANRRGLSEEQINQMLDMECEKWFDDSDDQSDLGSFDAHSEKDYHHDDEFGEDDSEDEVIHMDLDSAPDVFLLDQSPMRLRPLQSQDLAPVHAPASSTNEAVNPSENPRQGSISDQPEPTIQPPASNLAPVHGAPSDADTPSTSRAPDARLVRRQLIYPQPSQSAGITLRTGKHSRKVPRGGQKNQWTMRAHQTADVADVHASTSTAGTSTAPNIELTPSETAGSSTAPDIAPVHGCDEDPDLSPWRPSRLQRRQSRSRRVGRGRSAFSLGSGSEDPDDPFYAAPGGYRSRSRSPLLEASGSPADIELPPPTDAPADTTPSGDDPMASPEAPPSIGSSGPPSTGSSGGHRRGRRPARGGRRGRTGRAGRSGSGRGRAVPLVPILTGADLPMAAVVPRPHRGSFANLHVLTQRSYKRARGPVNKPGGPIYKLPIATIMGKDKRTQWHAEPSAGAQDIVQAPYIPLGRPSDHVAAAVEPVQLFTLFMDEEMLETIVNFTNEKMETLRMPIKMPNRGKATYANTTLTELKALIGCLIMAGIRHDNMLQTDQMFSNIYGCMFYKTLFSQKRFEFLIR